MTQGFDRFVNKRRVDVQARLIAAQLEGRVRRLGPNSWALDRTTVGGVAYERFLGTRELRRVLKAELKAERKRERRLAHG